MTTRALLTIWTFNPLVVVACLAIVAAHLASLAGASGARDRRSGARTIALVAAIAAVLLALASPIAALAAGYLFSAHMMQHLLLVLVAPPLLLLAMPARPRWLASPIVQRAASWLVAHPIVGWGAGLGAMWFWHAQPLCELATRSDAVRGLQAVSLLVLGAAFYWPLLAPEPAPRLAPLGAMAYLFSACIGCTLLGVLITFSPLEVCPAYLHPNDALGVMPLLRDGWGMTPAVDQQIGGLIMWVPACFVYVTGILAQVARLYRTPEAAP